MSPEQWYERACKPFQQADCDDATRRSGWELGLLGELGEVCDVLKKYYLHKHPLEETRTKLKLELGDAYWYVCALLQKPVEPWFGRNSMLPDVASKQAVSFAVEALKSHEGSWDIDLLLGRVTACLFTIGVAFDFHFPEVLQANHDKLHARFKSGKFTTEESINRSDK